MIPALVALPAALSAAQFLGNVTGLTGSGSGSGSSVFSKMLDAIGLSSGSDKSTSSSTSGGATTSGTTTSGGTTGAGATSVTEGTAAKKNDVVNQADFMQLLIAQLQNQDPLSPLDSANFSAQLAQFSSLEQLTQINDRLATQSGQDGASRFDAVSFIGRQVTGAGKTVTFADGKATGLDYRLDAAGRVGVTVVDANGREVAKASLGAQGVGAHHLDLAGIPDLAPLADGAYTVQLTTSDDAGNATTIATTLTGRVTGVDLSTNPPVLLLGEQRLALAHVSEIKELPSAGAAS